MIAAEVQFYDVVVWLHISAVVVGFGPTFAFGVYAAFTQKNHPRSIPAMLAAQNAVVRSLVIGGMLVILVTGLYLAIDRELFDEVFVMVGLAAVIVLFGLVQSFFLPNDTRAKELAERDIAASGEGDVKFSDEFETVNARSARVGAIAGLMVILTIYFMAAKPFV